MKPALSVVKPTPAPDVTMLLRAEIMERDWSACHIRGDRNPPLSFLFQNRRGWWK